jgi:tetratricopeptide (TPR) repeat protein
LGHGQAVDRAWLFVLLARQQGLDVVLLGLDDKQNPSRPWLPALVKDDDLYLFDCRLGLPIPGPEGRGVATLAQVAADDALLRRLDLDTEHPYPVHAGDLEHVVAYIEASPESLSRRMALVESRLAGKHKLVLTSPAAALAERLKKLSHVGDAKLWPWPFEVVSAQLKLDTEGLQAVDKEMTVFRALPDMFKARSLYFKGQYDGDNGARRYFLSARPGDAYLKNYNLPAEMARQVKQEDIPRVEASHIVLMTQAKQDASYWLGLLVFQEQAYPAAIDFFATRTLAASPGGPWTSGAHYNLGRTYEATGDIEKAIAQYEADTASPQSIGNRLRARWLKEKGAQAKPTEAAAP